MQKYWGQNGVRINWHGVIELKFFLNPWTQCPHCYQSLFTG